MSSSVQSLIDYGNNGLIVDIECHLSNNLPNIVIVGFVSKAVDEARERVRGAFASSGIEMPRRRITINLAPADIPKASSSFDLAIAAAIIQAGRHTSSKKSQAETSDDSTARRFTKQEAVMGELGLDGAVRAVRGIIGKIIAGRSRGITTFYIPAANLPQASLVPDVTLVPLVSLRELYGYLTQAESDPELVRIATGAGSIISNSSSANNPSGTSEPTLSLSDVIGQQQAKRALEIAAAGGHNVLLNGPPGTGKSMLARALPSILPELTTEEMLEVTHLHSLASKEYDRLICSRPFRSPHHSASHIAVVGGGSVLRPGEISLAHRGVLFFDELPEFNRSTIEALRQPLEDRRITIARASERLEFPADFILIATANPCPCGYYGTTMATRSCECAPAAIQRYRAKLSGPILDRIDLYSDVHEVDHAVLLGGANSDAKAEDEAIKDRIKAARGIQARRYGSPMLNASMTNRDVTKYAKVTAEAKELLDTAARSLDMSARAYMRTVKVARTIADLADSKQIELPHITEALQYRSRNFQT